MEMITLEQYEQIRRMYHLEEKSGRQIARELSCSRQTVSRALSFPRVAQRDEGKQADENHLPVEERSSGEREQIRAVFQLSAVMT
jgi:DNA invertase Pin-like site-specific DNA recombinase